MENTNVLQTNVLQQLEKNGEEEEQEVEGVPVCDANLASPVTDTAYFIEQVHYKIGTRLYIENAD
ncbi:MAG TPA: hypothetical protein VIP70_05560 [Nitrososphaeraceae archaeon]